MHQHTHKGDRHVFVAFEAVGRAGSNQEGQKVKSHIAQDAKGGIDGIPGLNSSQLEEQDLDTGH